MSDVSFRRCAELTAVRGRLPRRGVVAGLLMATVVASLIAGCSTTTSGGASAVGGVQAGSACQKYSGFNNGAGFTISFTACGAGIEGLTGAGTISCGLNGFSLDSFTVDSTIAVGADGSFTSDVTVAKTSLGTATRSFTGKLDGSGHASGTYRYNNPGACSSGDNPVPWTATAANASATSPSAAAACSPQPCGTSGGVTVQVTGLSILQNPGPVREPPSDSPQVVEVTFTVTNGSSNPLSVETSPLALYGIEPGTEATVRDTEYDGSAALLPDGSNCGSGPVDLQPGAHSGTLNDCFVLTQTQRSEPLKFLWGISANSGDINGIIDLSGMAIQ